MCFFGSFGQIQPPEMAEFGQNDQRYFETWAFPGYFFVTDGRRVLTIGSYERSWRVVVSFDRFCHLKWPNLAEKPKSFSFSKHEHPSESGGGWDPFVFHKYFLVRPQPKSRGPRELGCPSVCLFVCPSVITFLYGLELFNGRS